MRGAQIMSCREEYVSGMGQHTKYADMGGVTNIPRMEEYVSGMGQHVQHAKYAAMTGAQILL